MKNITLEEAYDKIFKIIDELKDSGIKVTIRKSDSRNDTELITKYSKKSNDRLPPERWCHVEFTPHSEKDRKLIFKKAIELAEDYGISFDTGSGFGNVDWEIDWSFHIDVNMIDEKVKRLKSVQTLSK